MPYLPLRGRPLPFGATPDEKGVNFSLFSKNAVNVIIELFQNFYDETPIFSYSFHPVHNKTGDVWHVYLEGVAPGAFYGYRVFGPYCRNSAIGSTRISCSPILTPKPTRESIYGIMSMPMATIRTLRQRTCHSPISIRRKVTSRVSSSPMMPSIGRMINPYDIR